MKPLVVDLESYYDSRLSVQEMCLQRYWSESYVYLLSLVTESFKWVGTPEELFRDPIAMGHLLDPQFDLWAVNSNFDQTGTETFFPAVTGRRWQCVSDFAVSHQRPRNLAELHEILTGEKVSKRIRGSMKGVHYSEIMEFDRERIRDYNILDSQQALRDIKELIIQCGPMSAVEEGVAEHTRMISRRGMAFDEEFIGKCREALYWVRHNAAKEMPWVAEGEKALAAQAFNTFCCKKGVAPPANLQKDAADFTAWMEANPTLAPFLKARQRYELANRKLSHIEKFLSRTFEGTYYPDLLYCGAPHTRRWSSKGSSDGSEGGDDTHSGFNLQNMDREPLFGDILTDFFSPLPPQRDGKPIPGIFFRNFIVPRPGKVFIILDFEQIEPRCLAWIVGNEAFLQKIRDGYGVYEAFARTSLGWSGGPLKTEDAVLYKTAKAQCLVGETLVLTERRGYRHITDIYIDDRVWDGSKWVNHDGVICRGSQKTIGACGERGTSDHIIYTPFGRQSLGTLPTGSRSCQFQRRCVPRANWSDLGQLATIVAKDTAEVGLSICFLCMRTLSKATVGFFGKLKKGSHESVLRLWKPGCQANTTGPRMGESSEPARESPSRQVAGDNIEVLRPSLPRLQGLRRAGDSSSPGVSRRAAFLRILCRTPRSVNRTIDRPGREQRGLCPRELEILDSSRTEPKH